MTPQQWELVKSVFAEAVEMEARSRDGFLTARCAGDDAVRAEIDRLLSLQAERTLALDDEQPADNSSRDGKPGEVGRLSPFLRADDRIGSYRVLGVLGEGGMGIVYLAQQERPRRTVALKVIRPGLVTAEMLRRFEHEAHVLGRLQHPGIAQIFEAGTANTGRGPQPYFAMELLRGRTLVQFAAADGLGTRERMELMARVCDAVQHAHDKGVVHRDLKPGNILVDESGQPKVLDFGVARVTDADVQATTLRTDMGQLLGTVPYMSPEQAVGAVDDVDRRSDVYSLGVVLYELLTEHLPYEISGRMVHEAVRIIREDEPRRLSSLDPSFRGDIETIVGKALLKERSRRYQSAAELGADIRRYLRNEPITARAPTAAYQIARFAKQHRAHEAAEAMAINKFLQELLASSESIHSSGKEVTVRQILDRAAGRIEAGSLRDRPELEAELRTSLGLTYRALRAPQQAEVHLRAALGISQKLLGDEHPTVAALKVWLGQVLYTLAKPEEALGLLHQSLECRERTLGANHPEVADGICALAELMYAEEQIEVAEHLYRRAMAIGHSGAPGSAAAESAVLMGLAGCLVDLGRVDEAEPILQRCLALQAATLPEGHWRMLVTRGLIAACLVRRGLLEQAEPVLLQVWTDLGTTANTPPIVRHRVAAHLARLYEAAGRPESARLWSARAK